MVRTPSRVLGGAYVQKKHDEIGWLTNWVIDQGPKWHKGAGESRVAHDQARGLTHWVHHGGLDGYQIAGIPSGT